MKPSDLSSRGLWPTRGRTSAALIATTPPLEGPAKRMGCGFVHSDCLRRLDPLGVLGSAHALTVYGEKFRGRVPWNRT